MVAELRELLVGSWRLERFEIKEPSGRIREWGRNPKGLLLYSADGFMSVSINREIENKAPDPAQNTLDSLLFYAGPYRVEGDTIFHDVTIASSPTRIGKTMMRQASIEGDTLTLKAPTESFGAATLIWKKLH